MKKNTIIGLGAVLVIGAAIIIWQQNDNVKDPSTAAAIATVRVPEKLSIKAAIGSQTFDKNCASCHGANAAGKKGIAPPLVHRVYEPSHHGDEAFQRAVAMGTRSHHWPFGDMPPVEGLNREDVSRVISYVRELQQENGIR